MKTVIALLFVLVGVVYFLGVTAYANHKQVIAVSAEVEQLKACATATNVTFDECVKLIEAQKTK